jgi:hypothetical protein
MKYTQHIRGWCSESDALRGDTRLAVEPAQRLPSPSRGACPHTWKAINSLLQLQRSSKLAWPQIHNTNAVQIDLKPSILCNPADRGYPTFCFFNRFNIIRREQRYGFAGFGAVALQESDPVFHTLVHTKNSDLTAIRNLSLQFLQRKRNFKKTLKADRN